MQFRPESSPLPRLTLLALGLMAAIAAMFVSLFSRQIIHGVYCPLRTATGVPCPTCGSTHAIVSLLHGHLFGALRYNPLTTATAVLFAAAFTWAAVASISPRWRIVPVLSALEKRAILYGTALLLLANWFYEVWRLI